MFLLQVMSQSENGQTDFSCNRQNSIIWGAAGVIPEKREMYNSAKLSLTSEGSFGVTEFWKAFSFKFKGLHPLPGHGPGVLVMDQGCWS